MILPNPFARRGNTEDANTILEYAIDWAMQAGKLQMEKFRSRHLGIETKSSMHDVVTDVDKACEKLLIERITTTYPNHSILGEETGLHQKPNSEWEWVVDPLDGTNNYSQGLPIFCVSIGVKYKGETIVGVVYAPKMDDLFTGLRKQTSYEDFRQKLMDIQYQFYNDCPFVCLYYRTGNVISRYMYTACRDIREFELLRGIESFFTR